MHRPIDRLPWAIHAPRLVEGALDAATAEYLFGSAFIEHATYSIGTDAYARMHTTLQTGQASNLSHYYTGEPCINGHVTTRRARPQNRSECDECRRIYKRRAKQR